MSPLAEYELQDGIWLPRFGADSPLPPPTGEGFVPGWGFPVWSDERADRRAHGLVVDPAKWNARGTEVNNFDYAVVDPTMAYYDTDGYLHLTADWLPSPNLNARGGSVTASAASDVVTCSAAHNLSVGEMVYVVNVSGGGIPTGYYFVKTKPSATTLTLTATFDMYPGGIGPTFNVTANSTVQLYRPRFMKTAYLDHRIIAAGDVQPDVRRFGRFEMRARPPSSPTVGRGVLAAWWRRNSGTIVPGGPAGAEWDLMESWGSGPVPKTDPGTSRLTFFEYSSVPAGGTQFKKFWDYDDDSKAAHNDAHLGFHVWTHEYMPTYMKSWRDGVLTASETPASAPQLWGSTTTNPFHMRLNLHMGAGAQFWGIPDPAHPEWTATPTDYVVDYVRVWEAP